MRSIPSCSEKDFLSHQSKHLFWLLQKVSKTSKRKQNTENLKNLFSAFVLREEATKRKDKAEASQRPMLPSNCQALVAEAIRQTVFFEMFLSVAYINGSLFRKYILCKLSTARCLRLQPTYNSTLPISCFSSTAMPVAVFVNFPADKKSFAEDVFCTWTRMTHCSRCCGLRLKITSL